MYRRQTSALIERLDKLLKLPTSGGKGRACKGGKAKQAKDLMKPRPRNIVLKQAVELIWKIQCDEQVLPPFTPAALTKWAAQAGAAAHSSAAPHHDAPSRHSAAAATTPFLSLILQPTPHRAQAPSVHDAPPARRLDHPGLGGGAAHHAAADGGPSPPPSLPPLRNTSPAADALAMLCRKALSEGPV